LPPVFIEEAELNRRLNAIWGPEYLQGRKPMAPVGTGMDRKTGKLLMGWQHTQQSMSVIFATPYHTRVLRRYVGSFVPHILGETAVALVITRFFWAIATGIENWEPRYRIKYVHAMEFALADAKDSPRPETSSADELRLGHAFFRTEGVYRPRAHLGDFTPLEQRQLGLVGRGQERWIARAMGTGSC
jgi:Bacteriophage baseplate protein W